MDSLQTMTVLQYLALIHEQSYVNVCKSTGITPQQFSDWVKKRRPVPKERLHSLAEFFKIEANLLIDDRNYLQDLTSEMKIDIQILFLKRKLEDGGDGADLEPYQQKLVNLHKEKEVYILVGRFTSIVSKNNQGVREICESFLDHLEKGNFRLLEQILNKKGFEK